VRTANEIGELGAAFDEMAERLQRLVEGQRELLANVSHELRTPLARLQITLGLAGEADPATVRRYLDEIGIDVAELERLVEDLLTAARLETGYASVLRRERVEVAAALADAARRFERAHPGRVLALDVAERLPALDADPSLLGRAIDNLLDNAAKYSEARASIAMAARPDQGGLELEIRDQGIGIEEADLPRLFTPFFRSDRSRSRGSGGVGLGLALTRRIVEAHGGTIAVESRAGEGTTVRLRLPAAPLSP
jgi:signal transduction histidine kinase